MDCVPDAIKRPRLSTEQDSHHTGKSMSDLPNPHLDSLENDFLYHIGYSRRECEDKFKDVKVLTVCVCV